MRLLGQPVKEAKLEQIKQQIKELGFTPSLSIIVADGYNQASTTYVNNKIKLCEELGINYELIKLEYENKTREEVLEGIKYIITTLNSCKKCNGYFIQIPLPYGITEDEFSHLIDYKKDVDGFAPINLGRLYKGMDCIVPCTAQAIMDILKYYNIELEGKNVLVINRSQLVGIPLVPLLLKENATVEVAHSRTTNLKDKIAKADIVVSAVGRENFINHLDVAKGTTIIDVSINRNSEGKLCGDINKDSYDELDNMNCDFTPVPRGVGICTVMNIAWNIVKCCQLQKK